MKSLSKFLAKILALLSLISSAMGQNSYSAIYCPSEDQTETQSKLCAIFNKVELGLGCSTFEDPVGQNVCLALQNLVSGGNCIDEFFTTPMREDKINTLITCHEIYYGMQEKTCDHSIKELFRSLGIEYELDRYLPPQSRKALCLLGHAIPKNRMVFMELRKNALLMAAIEPLIQKQFLNLQTMEASRISREVRNLSSHILKKLDDLKIGKTSAYLLNHNLTHSDWLRFFKQLIQVIDKNSSEWVQKSAAKQMPLRFDSGTLFENAILPAGLLVFPDGRIIVFFDNLISENKKVHPLKAIGEGGYKRVYLAFDYKNASQTLSDGFNDPTTLVGGYIKQHKRVTAVPGQSWDQNLFLDIQKEVEIQNRWNEQEGIASKNELVNLYGQTKLKEKLVVLGPYYPLDLIHLRNFMNSPDIESINGKSRDRIVFNIAKNLLTGLNFLHKNLIHHRDIKPDNILIDTEKDGSYQGFISDFGTALDLNLCANTSLCDKLSGTLAYMAPEYASEFNKTEAQRKLANQNLKNDVWAMGLTLYYLERGMLHLPAAVHTAEGKIPNPLVTIKSYNDLKRVYGINYSLIKPNSGTLDYLIYRMLDPDMNHRSTSEESLELLKHLTVVLPYSATDYLANVQFLQNSDSKPVQNQQDVNTKQGKLQKDEKLNREVEQVDKESLHRFKKELLKIKYN